MEIRKSWRRKKEVRPSLRAAAERTSSMSPASRSRASFFREKRAWSAMERAASFPAAPFRSR